MSKPTYEDLEAQIKHLAAENAKMKEFISLECMVFGDNNNLLVAESFIPETPATDAFLAEVRTQGVEVVIAYHQERADALHHVDRSNAIRHSMAALDASDVAAKLRKGLPE